MLGANDSVRQPQAGADFERCLLGQLSAKIKSLVVPASASHRPTGESSERRAADPTAPDSRRPDLSHRGFQRWTARARPAVVVAVGFVHDKHLHRATLGFRPCEFGGGKPVPSARLRRSGGRFRSTAGRCGRLARAMRKTRGGDSQEDHRASRSKLRPPRKRLSSVGRCGVSVRRRNRLSQRLRSRTDRDRVRQTRPLPFAPAGGRKAPCSESSQQRCQGHARSVRHGRPRRSGAAAERSVRADLSAHGRYWDSPMRNLQFDQRCGGI